MLFVKGHFGAQDNTLGLVYEASSFAESRDMQELARPLVELANTERAMYILEKEYKDCKV